MSDTARMRRAVMELLAVQRYEVLAGELDLAVHCDRVTTGDPEANGVACSWVHPSLGQMCRATEYDVDRWQEEHSEWTRVQRTYHQHITSYAPPF